MSASRAFERQRFDLGEQQPAGALLGARECRARTREMAGTRFHRLRISSSPSSQQPIRTAFHPRAPSAHPAQQQEGGPCPAASCAKRRRAPRTAASTTGLTLRSTCCCSWRVAGRPSVPRGGWRAPLRDRRCVTRVTRPRASLWHTYRLRTRHSIWLSASPASAATPPLPAPPSIAATATIQTPNPNLPGVDQAEAPARPKVSHWGPPHPIPRTTRPIHRGSARMGTPGRGGFHHTHTPPPPPPKPPTPTSRPSPPLRREPPCHARRIPLSPEVHACAPRRARAGTTRYDA